MKLTKQLKNEYLDKANKEFENRTGLAIKTFYIDEDDKVRSPIRIKMEQWGDFISIYLDFTNRYKLHRYPNWPSYWPGNKHKIFESNPYSYYINQELWDLLISILSNRETILAVKEWNDLCKMYEQKATKNEKSREKIRMAGLDFDGCITANQIIDQYPDFHVKFMKTKITFHEIISKGFSTSCGFQIPDTWMQEPMWSINIRPVNRNLKDFSDKNLMYNKKDFETAMSSWKHYKPFNT